VLVDGKSKDNTLKIAVRILNNSKFNWEIVSDDGRGLGYARQLIVEHSKGIYLGFVDSDQQLHPTWLNMAIEHLKSDPKVAAVRGVQGLTYNLPLSGALENYVKYIDEHEAPLECKVDYFGLGGSVLKKAAVVDAGGFRAMFRFVSEDTDLAARLKRLGYKIHNLQSAIFYHYSRPTWQALFKQYRGYGYYFRTIEKIYKEEARNYRLLIALWNILYCPLISVRTIFKAYKFTKDKRCVLMPFYYAFRLSAWTIGYASARYVSKRK
jgi:cellulose synthase/poly-beta-1,6-N-acetylglucosamine synthase-like glycosyltransferase